MAELDDVIKQMLQAGGAEPTKFNQGIAKDFLKRQTTPGRDVFNIMEQSPAELSRADALIADELLNSVDAVNAPLAEHAPELGIGDGFGEGLFRKQNRLQTLASRGIDAPLRTFEQKLKSTKARLADGGNSIDPVVAEMAQSSVVAKPIESRPAQAGVPVVRAKPTAGGGGVGDLIGGVLGGVGNIFKGLFGLFGG